MTVNDFISRAALATGRNFTAAQYEILLVDLKAFRSDLFAKIADEYLGLETPPRNLVGYFRKRGAEINGQSRDAAVYHSDGERPGPGQGGLYMQIINVATTKYAGDDYISWCQSFSAIWMGYNGDALTGMLAKTLSMLQQMPDAVRGQASRDLCMLDNIFDGKADPVAHKRRNPYPDDGYNADDWRG